jgi:hypothetical protein
VIKIKNSFLINNYLLLILLIVHFLINIAIYLNTNTFSEISESRSIFDAYYSLIKGENFFQWQLLFLLLHYCIFITEIIGNDLFYYFIFQIILSTVTVYVIYKIIFHIKIKKTSCNRYVLMIFYLEYNLLGSIFYNQLYEIFWFNIIILLIVIYDEKKLQV